MLWVKAFHIIAMVAWFAGLFYLPRLFVYHATTLDELSLTRFKIMEWRLYYAIMWPAAVVTLLLGVWLISFNHQYYMHAGWLQAKLILVGLLFLYHLMCGRFMRQLAGQMCTKSDKFFRFYNELPTLLLIAIVILVVVKPI